jgi:ATP-dependent RNA helicase RhlE
LTTFASLDLIEPLQRALAAKNYVEPTPIQAQAIPPLLQGNDVLGCAQTGTGKTAAFLLPILQHLATHPSSGKPVIRALVLTPTRELAAQIGDNFEEYGQFLRLRHQVIFGGVSQRPQVSALRRGIDAMIATPGRLLDLHGQGFINFDNVEFFVLDEADRMLDMGFIRDIQRIIKMLPRDRQNLLFSATMPSSIVKLASAFLHNPIRVEVDPESTTVERIDQQIMFVSKGNKKRLLIDLLEGDEVESAIVFTRTKHGANRVTKDLEKWNIRAAAIHGNKSQGARKRALANFKSGELRILVATDIASRGIDVDGVSHVINYELPNIAESYVHRIGRTGRAGKRGIAIAFCDETETAYLQDIERLIKQKIDVIEDHEWHCQAAVPIPGVRATPPKRGGGGGGGGRGRGGGGRGGGGGRDGGGGRSGGRGGYGGGRR